ncbi:slipin family protein [Actinomadura sp. HBU206391]|uniref:slipin family protein n=1 Tax=Actinomadura sp. HBU206391 TaxID=2731692 RepID=UPI001650756D|nr:slipin family protein [Actinomadura sp. HBU206391]MBC6463391.1 slipin family protein [Actinomadura sp. HBU206391]
MARVTVMEWQRTLLFVDGRLDRVLEPGRYRYRARRSELVTVEMRPRLLHVNGQEVITQDGISVRISVVVTWAVADPVVFATGAESSQLALYAAVQEAIRHSMTTATLEDLLTDRGRMSAGLPEALTERAAALGITVTEAHARDLMLPGELRRAAQETLLAREHSRAELERARGEAAALRSLANTARLLEEHPSLLQLRTLQVAAEPGTRIILDPRSLTGDGRRPDPGAGEI